MDEQEARGHQDAAELGVTIVKVYAEPPGSASRFARRHREKWTEIIGDVQADQWDVLMTWKVDRATRRLRSWLEFLDLCRDCGKLIYVITQRHLYDPRVWRDRKTLIDEGTDAEGYSEELSINVHRALGANLLDGRPHGAIPYGYQREYAIRNGKVIPVRQFIREDQAAVIRWAAEKYLSGWSLRRICGDLNTREVPTPRGGRRWEEGALRKILTNPVYIGKLRSHGKVVGDGAWPAVLEERDQLSLQHLMAVQATRYAAGPTREGPNLLSGIAECGRCDDGGEMRVFRTTAPKNAPHRRYRVYSCRRCLKVARSQPWVDAYVTEWVLTLLESPQLAQLLAEEKDSAALRAALDERLAVQQRMDEIKPQLTAVNGRAAHVLLAALADLQEQLVAAEERVQALSGVSPLSEVAGPKARDWWSSPDTTMEQRRFVVRALVRVRILKAEKGRHRDYTLIEITPRRPELAALLLSPELAAALGSSAER